LSKDANAKFLLLKKIDEGKDGLIVLAVPRNGPQNASTITALKIIKHLAIGSISEFTLEKLKTLERKYADEHFIAAVLEYPASIYWINMEFILGRSVKDLMDTTYAANGMPPTLVFHVMAEVVQAQTYLQEQGPCHMDLWAGGKVMLRARDDDLWPSVVLIDYGGIMAYHQHKQVQHTVQLVQTMINREKTIPDYWRSDTFNKGDLELADRFYKKMCGYEFEGKASLEGLWKAQGPLVKQLKETFRDDVVLHALKAELEGKRVTDE
jgi:serine/threonine protein kinase